MRSVRASSADRGVDRAETGRARLGRAQPLGRRGRSGQHVRGDAEIDRTPRSGQCRRDGVDRRGHGLLRRPWLEHRLGQRREQRPLVAALVEQAAHPAGVRSRAGTSLAITSTAERDAAASPKAASVLAAPGPVVVMATPSPPVALASPSAAYAAVCSCRTPMMRGRSGPSASQKARLCTPGRPKAVRTPAAASTSSTRPAVVTSTSSSAMGRPDPPRPGCAVLQRGFASNLSTQRRVVAEHGGGGRVGGMSAYVTRNPADLEDVVTTVDLVEQQRSSPRAGGREAPSADGRDVPPPVRGRVIAQVGRLVEDNKEALAALVTREVGKPYAEALGEVQEVIDTCDFFLGEGRRLYGKTVPSEMPDKQLFTFRVPVGVAAIITAANFPTAVPSWYLVPALLCGNAVVWKPAETSAARRTGAARAVPPGRGARGRARSRARRRPDDVRPAFGRPRRGSRRQGRASPARRRWAVGSASSRAATCRARASSSAARTRMVVMPDADLDLAVEGALFSGFGTSGQRCTSLGTVWAHREVYDDVPGRFIAAVEDAVVGDPYEDVLYGPMLSPRYLDNHERNLELVAEPPLGARLDGHRAHHVGQPAQGVRRRPGHAASSPTRRSSRASRPGDALYDTETFGPLVGLGVFDSLDEAIELANGHGYGLSAAIYTGDAEAGSRRSAPASARGWSRLNNSTSGAEAHLPFGGNGRSRQRFPAVRRLGPRPVHPVAGDELGLLRSAPEGSDGRARAAVRPGLPPVTDLPKRAGVVVVGGGVMGCPSPSTLPRRACRTSSLLDRGPLGAGSTSKAAGGVRAQFADELNVVLGARRSACSATSGTGPGRRHRPPSHGLPVRADAAGGRCGLRGSDRAAALATTSVAAHRSR